MSKFTDQLWSDLVREHGPTLAHADRPKPGRVRRPRILAGSTLGLAGVGAALLLVLGGSAATPAFAITKQGDGSVLVKLNYLKDLNLPQVDQRLKELGTHEQITIYMAPGAAAVSGPVTCTPAMGAASPSGPPVKVLVGSNGTEVIGQGQSAGNTAEGSFHLDRCVVTSDTAASNAGNTGAG
jgi:hypothetical protein